MVQFPAYGVAIICTDEVNRPLQMRCRAHLACIIQELQRGVHQRARLIYIRCGHAERSLNPRGWPHCAAAREGQMVVASGFRLKRHANAAGPLDRAIPDWITVGALGTEMPTGANYPYRSNNDPTISGPFSVGRDRQHRPISDLAENMTHQPKRALGFAVPHS